MKIIYMISSQRRRKAANIKVRQDAIALLKHGVRVNI